MEGYGSVEIPSGKGVEGSADVSMENRAEVESGGSMGRIEKRVQSVREVENAMVVWILVIVSNVMMVLIEIPGQSGREALIWIMARSEGEEEELEPLVRRPSGTKGPASGLEAPSGKVQVLG